MKWNDLVSTANKKWYKYITSMTFYDPGTLQSKADRLADLVSFMDVYGSWNLFHLLTTR